MVSGSPVDNGFFETPYATGGPAGLTQPVQFNQPAPSMFPTYIDVPSSGSGTVRMPAFTVTLPTPLYPPNTVVTAVAADTDGDGIADSPHFACPWAT